MSKSRIVSLMVVLTLVWGVSWSSVKVGVIELPPLWFRSLTLVLGIAVLALVLTLRGTSLRLPRGMLGRIVVLSIPNIVVWYGAVTIALTTLDSGRAAILGFTMPAWAALIGIACFGERLDLPSAIGLASALAAIVLLVAGDYAVWAVHPLGVVLMLVAAASWAWGTHALRRARPDIDTLLLTFWMLVVATPVIVAASAAMEGASWRLPTGREWMPVLYNGVVVIAIGDWIWFGIARRLTPTASGLSTMMIPVVGVFSGMLVLGESPGWRERAALVLVCVAVAMAMIARPALADTTEVTAN